MPEPDDQSGPPATSREALSAATAEQVVALERRVETALRREHPVVFWVTLLVPLVGWLGLVGVMVLTRGEQFAAKVLGLTVLIEAVVGRFVILTGAAGGGGAFLLTRTELFWLVAWIDATVATLFLYHATFIYRLWKVGPWLERLRDASRDLVARRPILGRFSFVGVVLYVGLPLISSGAVLGSMLGQLLGLSRLATLGAVLIGTLLGNSLMLLLAEVVMSVPFLQRQHPGVLLGSLVLFGVVLAFVQWRLSRRGRGAANDSSRDGPG